MINSQTPEESDAFFQQYSEEEVRHAFDMVADPDGQLPDELAEHQQAYDEMTVDPKAMSRYREVLKFREALFRATPRVFITRLLLLANVLVFLAMALRGVNVMSPTGEELIAWGANAGWLTLDGQSWRLFTCMFLAYRLDSYRSEYVHPLASGEPLRTINRQRGIPHPLSGIRTYRQPR